MDGMTDFEKLLYAELKTICRDVGDLKRDMAVLKVRSGLLGVVGGGIVMAAGKIGDWMGWFK